MWKSLSLVCAVCLLVAAPVMGDAPKVEQFQKQTVGGTTYFRVHFASPETMQLPTGPIRGRLALGRLPRLVPQDGNTHGVNLSLAIRGDDLVDGLNPPKQLEFFGRATTKGKATFKLMIPIAAKPGAIKGETELQKVIRDHDSWATESVTLDFASAKEVAAPNVKRQSDQAPAADDLAGQWAWAQAASYAVLESLTPQFGFYTVARKAVGRLYSVPARPLPQVAEAAVDYDPMNLYGLMTATSVITEALAMNRLDNPKPKKQEDRTVDIKNVRGIGDPEHPWKKLMDGKKPSASVVAKMIPHDNYFLHFKNISKLIEFADWFEPVGNTMAQLFSPTSRDDRIKQRYEQQMCIEMNFIARLFGPAVVKSISITGSDPYIREGADLTVILRVASQRIFLFGANNYISRTQKKWGKELKVSKEKFGKAVIERYVTPLREVSLHRALFDDYIIYSNSKTALQRVLETHLGKRQSLSESADFQYVRSVFPIEDKKEDGFLFLSGSFVRNLVGPKLRIKERRRLEAVTSLQMATHGALYAAWNNGKLPDSNKAMLASSGLTNTDLAVPNGDPVSWDAKRGVAVSKKYNTIHFATPLIELPIDKITPSEQVEYDTFRKDYLAEYKDYLDPVAIRFAIDKKRVRVEVFATPLANNSEYEWLRELSPGGKVAVHPDLFDPNALVEMMAYISPNSPQAKSLNKALRQLVRKIPPIPWLGSFVTAKLDDTTVLEKYAEQKVLQQLGVKKFELSDDLHYVAKLPTSLGLAVQRPLILRVVLGVLQAALGEAFPGAMDWRPLPPYRGIGMSRVTLRTDGLIGNLINGDRKPADRVTPTVCYAQFNRHLYLAQNVDILKRIIDHKAKVEANPPAESEVSKANVTLRVSPSSAKEAKGFLNFAAAWESHHRALTNTAYLLPLYQGNLLKPKSSRTDVAAQAWQYLGFVPVSADGQSYSFSTESGEVVNKLHGSISRPKFTPQPPPGSPTARLLTRIRWLRADINFEANGLRLVTTIRKQ